ncbi:hypothetical protein Pint_25334 [Pistacia integerrima]|uniref:Uncharacterized protein n=1 Tax=Pistacia integerrima TaxID=434235 RepID=A0ACC0YDG0_9ROSI|nr:hypothetical protein Pint_25334 [Pistacia integerrima]
MEVALHYAIRIAKDLAENNKGAHILIVVSEVTLAGMHDPSETNIDVLVCHSLFGDGSSALIVDADPVASVEKPIFELVSIAPVLVHDSFEAICGAIREGISNWSSIFWAAHLGGLAILDQIQAKLSLEPEKLYATRHVLGEYGNMSSVTVLFVLDEMRKKPTKDGLKTTGEGLEWAVLLFGFGLGLTNEMLVIHSVNIA